VKVYVLMKVNDSEKLLDGESSSVKILSEMFNALRHMHNILLRNKWQGQADKNRKFGRLMKVLICS
jgi:hypothetical protein